MKIKKIYSLKYIFYLLIIILIIKLIYNYFFSFPFPIYNFPLITKTQYEELIKGKEPVLFKNVLKQNIEWNDFCNKLENKELSVRHGDYGSTEGRKERYFKKEKLKNVCQNINNSSGYGGNNVISLDEQKKIQLQSSNPSINMFQKAKMWIGPSNSRTPLHKDTPDNLAIQLYGRKKWIFYNKNSNKHLCFDENNSTLEWSNYSINNFFTCPSALLARRYEKIMEPGDMLYLPSQWGHDVENVTNSIMINLWY